MRKGLAATHAGRVVFAEGRIGVHWIGISDGVGPCQWGVGWVDSGLRRARSLVQVRGLGSRTRVGRSVCSALLPGISSPSSRSRHGAIRLPTQMGSRTYSACSDGDAMPIASSHLVADAVIHGAVLRQRIS